MIYPVIEWLLQHMTELKERAYLARYLVKVDIPQDFMIDSQIAELYEQVRVCVCVNSDDVCMYSMQNHSGTDVRDPTQWR